MRISEFGFDRGGSKLRLSLASAERGENEKQDTFCGEHNWLVVDNKYGVHVPRATVGQVERVKTSGKRKAERARCKHNTEIEMGSAALPMIAS